MFTNVLNSAVIVLAAICGTTGGDEWSSTFAKENLSRFCPGSTGQMGAHVCADTVFTVSKNRAEDTGIEPLCRNSEAVGTKGVTETENGVVAV